MTTAAAAPKFDYGTVRLKDLAVKTSADKVGRTTVDAVTINGREAKATPRFWWSLQVRFGFTQNIFKYFSHAEVFSRISERNGNDRLRYCLETTGAAKPALLAVTNPANAVATHDEVGGLLTRHGSEGTQYANGVLRSTHAPKHGGKFAIAGEDFRSKFVIDTPIDGFGKPAIYLSLLRQICSNGAVAFTPTFRSELNTGKGNDGVGFALVRAIEGFNNEEGFAALRQRFESAARSWASVHEVQRVYKTLVRMHHNKGFRVPAKGGDGAAEVPTASPVLASFHRMTGDVAELYGLTNVDALSAKRQRTLPAACKVYDVLNFASEVATHHATPEGARAMQSLVGSTVSGEYDLEGTVDQFCDWRDFFIGHTATTSTLADVQK